LHEYTKNQITEFLQVVYSGEKNDVQTSDLLKRFPISYLVSNITATEQTYHINSNSSEETETLEFNNSSYSKPLYTDGGNLISDEENGAFGDSRSYSETDNLNSRNDILNISDDFGSLNNAIQETENVDFFPISPFDATLSSPPYHDINDVGDTDDAFTTLGNNHSRNLGNDCINVEATVPNIHVSSPVSKLGNMMNNRESVFSRPLCTDVDAASTKEIIKVSKHKTSECRVIKSPTSSLNSHDRPNYSIMETPEVIKLVIVLISNFSM